MKGLSHGAIETRKLDGVNQDKRHERFILVRPLTVKVKAYDPVLGGIAYVSITRERNRLT